MKKLLFYTIDKNYIAYLSQFENHISYNKDEIGHSRPYLGIVLKIEQYEYFVPLYSYKKHYTKYKNNFLKTIACNFKLLEEKCLYYK